MFLALKKEAVKIGVFGSLPYRERKTNEPKRWFSPLLSLASFNEAKRSKTKQRSNNAEKAQKDMEIAENCKKFGLAENCKNPARPK